MEAITLNESFKALIERDFDKKQGETLLKAFVEVVNDRATNQRLGIDELKSRAIDDIRAEFVTKEFVRAEIAEAKADLIKWVVGLQIAAIAIIVSAVKFL